MTVINQIFNKVVPFVTSEPLFTGKTLSGVLYKDDTWLESTKRPCVVLLVNPNHPDPVRSKFEVIARDIVATGSFFYLAYGYGQSGSMDLPYVLSSRNGKSSYHRMAYYGGLVTISHLSHLEVTLTTQLIADQPFTVVAVGEIGLGAVASIDRTIEFNNRYPPNLVKNIVLLDPLLTFTDETYLDDPYGFVSAWQSVFRGTKKTAMLFRTPPSVTEAHGVHSQARGLRYGLDYPKLIIASVNKGAVEVTPDWVETQSNLWISIALNHRDSDGFTLVNGTGSTLLAGL